MEFSRVFCRSTGVWGYTLNQSLADPLTDGQVVHDHLMVKSVDGTATYDIDVTITGTNDNATITASAGEDTAVKENGGIGNATVGDPKTARAHASTAVTRAAGQPPS